MAHDVLLRAVKALSKELTELNNLIETSTKPSTEGIEKLQKRQDRVLVTMLRTKKILDEAIEKSGLSFVKNLDIRIDSTNLLQRITRRLQRRHLVTLRDLTTQTEEDLLKIKAFGKPSVQAVREVLASYGLHLKGEHNQQGATLVEELKLPLRIETALKAALITTLERLLEATEIDLLKTNNLGRKSINEIKQALAFRGLYLKEE